MIPRRLAAVALAAALASAAPAAAEPLLIKDNGATLDLPEGWQRKSQAAGGSLCFADASGTAILQIRTFVAGSFASSADMAQAVGDSLAAEGEGASFLYSGRDATLSQMSFSAGTTAMRGWGLFVRGRRADFAVLAYAPERSYEACHDALLSALDSFCPEEELRLAPGPVGQFASRFPAEREGSRTLQVAGGAVRLATSAVEQAAGQDLVEREARILAAEKQRLVPAWQRYFRVIYRDNYMRLTSVAGELKAVLRDEPPRARAEALLAWLQGFRYTRTGTLSDLTSPLACLAETSGDCDSRALLYVMLLHHLDIDAVLLVSSRYQHSAVGVGVEGAGARIPVGGRSYVFAELTDKVALGLVAKDQADPTGWIPVVLGGPLQSP